MVLAATEMKIEPLISPTVSFGTKRQYLDSLHQCGKTHMAKTRRKNISRRGVRGK